MSRSDLHGLVESTPAAELPQLIGDLEAARAAAWARLTAPSPEPPPDTPRQELLRIPAAITKNRTGRTLGLEGGVKAIIERRLRLRRFNVPLIFHRVCKGKPGQPITDFWEVWKEALQAARLPSGRLFHDLRRSAVRTLIRAGVDETTAMKVSGHKTRSMLLRCNIVTERETADALLRADAYLSTQPTRAEGEKGQLRDIRSSSGRKSLTAQARDGSSGRIRTGEDPPTPDDSDPFDPGFNAT